LTEIVKGKDSINAETISRSKTIEAVKVEINTDKEHVKAIKYS